MAEAIDLERMMVQLEANSTKLERDFSKAVSIVNTFSDKMERRTDQLKSRIEYQFSQAGSNAARRLTGALAAGLSFAAIEQFVSHITETNENIEKQAKALGISTDAFQALSLSAKHASVDQDSFNSALDFFSKNIGLAQLKTTDFGKIMKRLGVDVHAGPEAAFYQFVDALNKISSPTQRNAVLTMAMGRSSVQMAAMLTQGSDALRAQATQFKANGEIIDHDGIEKLNKLAIAWSDFKAQLTVAGTNVLTGLTDQFSKFEGGLDSPQFQSALKNVGAQLANIAQWMLAISASPWFKYIAAAGIGAKIGGLPGAALAVGGTAAYSNIPSLTGPTNVDEARQRLKDAQAALDAARAGKGTINQYLPQSIRDIIDKISPFQDNTVTNALRARDDARKALQALQRQAAQGAKPASAITPAGNVDLSGFLDKAPKTGAAAAKTSEYAKAVADLITKTQQLSAAEDDSTAASAKAEASTRLLDAARADGLKITPALRKQIDDLSAAYARVTAARAFSKDLATEDERIAKLKEEAKQADLSAAAIAELEEREKLLAAFRDKFGKNAVPDAAQMAVINSRAAAFGAGTGADQFSKNVKGAQDEDKALQDQIQTVSLYGGALAEAQMRLTLINQAMQANGSVSAEDMAKITALAKAHGELTKQLEDEQEEEAKRVAVTDELRSGLENIGVTGVTSFKDLSSAAGQFLQQLAQLIVKLYVMQPILDALLGKQGTSGGGLLGSLISSIFGGGGTATASIPSGPPFASGGLVRGAGSGTSDSISARLSNGEFVMNAGATSRNLSMLSAMNAGAVPRARAAGATTIIFSPHIDARGATEGTAMMIHKTFLGYLPTIKQMVDTQTKANFPENARTFFRDVA